MESNYDLERFLEAQSKDYANALLEVRNGEKTSHWMWYVFPQIAGLGLSFMSQKYAILNLQEANTYLEHPILGTRLVEISTALWNVEGKTASEIFGFPDDLKLKSCMTLFSAVKNSHPVFQQVLDKYFEGAKDEKTLSLLAA